jgi:hypothetical protein
MKPSKHRLHIYQGSSWQLRARFKDPEQSLIDLSDYSGEMQIRRAVTHPEAIITLSTDNGGIIVDDDQADFNLIARMTRAQTEDLPTFNQEVEDWVYDIILWQNTDPDHTTIRLMQGTVYVSPAVTRDDDE